MLKWGLRGVQSSKSNPKEKNGLGMEAKMGKNLAYLCCTYSCAKASMKIFGLDKAVNSFLKVLSMLQSPCLRLLIVWMKTGKYSCWIGCTSFWLEKGCLPGTCINEEKQNLKTKGQSISFNHHLVMIKINDVQTLTNLWECTIDLLDEIDSLDWPRHSWSRLIRYRKWKSWAFW